MLQCTSIVFISLCLMPFLSFFFFAVNHKNEDELMRSFNRSAQRKILSRLQQTRPEQTDSESNMLNEQLQARLLFCPLHNDGKNVTYYY